MEWYERWFGKEYLVVYENRNSEEAEREIKTIKHVLNLKADELILDLCCGSGRHDIHLVNLECKVIGLDFSWPLLKIARSSFPPDSLYPQYIRADARDIPFRDGVFDVVLNLFTSFGYFEDRENQGFLRSLCRVLKTNGRFYIDYLNPLRVLSDLVEESVTQKNSTKIIEKRRYNTSTCRLEKTIVLLNDSNTRIYHESVRLYNCEEMLSMFMSAGLDTAGVLGSVDGDLYSESSERMILYGAKRK